MKKAFAALVLLGGFSVSGGVFAEHESCSSLGGLAESIMTARQSAVPMQELMALLEGDDAIPDFARTLAIDAYEQPAFHSEEARKKSIVEFQNKVYLDCIKLK